MVIYISTPQQLQAINNNLSGDYELVNDIDLSGIDFTPIGESTGNPFLGNFDGKGYKITNLNLNTSDNNFCGLFGAVRDGSIKNIGLQNFNINGKNFVGALVGYLLDGDIKSCYAINSFVNGETYVGGLTGISNSNATIFNCYSNTTVYGRGGNDNTKTTVGGLVGSANNTVIITNCYCYGEVSNTSNTANGLIGMLNNNTSYPTVINSYWDIETSGLTTSRGGGTGLTTSQMQQQSSYTDWDFDNIWTIENDYPSLKIFFSALGNKETITLNTSYLMPIQSVEVSKRKVVVSVSTSRKINSTLSKQLITSVTSIVNEIVSSIEVKENANVKSYTVHSELFPIDFSVSTHKRVTKVLTSTVKPFKSIIEVIIPHDVEKPIYANVYAIENTTNSFTLQNPSNIYEIENPTELEVI